MNDADRKFTYAHARRWCYDSPAYWMLADDYADWYMSNFGDAAETMAELPAHSTVWVDWTAGVT